MPLSPLQRRAIACHAYHDVDAERNAHMSFISRACARHLSRRAAQVALLAISFNHMRLRATAAGVTLP